VATPDIEHERAASVDPPLESTISPHQSIRVERVERMPLPSDVVVVAAPNSSPQVEPPIVIEREVETQRTQSSSTIRETLVRSIDVRESTVAIEPQRQLAELPAEAIDAAVARMAEADPQADVQLDLTCPACGHRWLALFDIVPFLWSEINAWAQRTLQDVHRLASAYGWREADVLALTPWRRQVYLEMAGG
jgi:citrate lyase gamma subunit